MGRESYTDAREYHQRGEMMAYEQWERKVLDCTGRYVGHDLTDYGFCYRQGEYIPAHERIAVYYEWKWAHAGERQSRGLVGLASA